MREPTPPLHGLCVLELADGIAALRAAGVVGGRLPEPKLAAP